jgi:hypothetical protein
MPITSKEFAVMSDTPAEEVPEEEVPEEEPEVAEEEEGG